MARYDEETGQLQNNERNHKQNSKETAGSSYALTKITYKCVSNQQLECLNRPRG